MSLAIVQSRACVGIHAPNVTIEVHISQGLPAFMLVGLAETTVKEARDRVRSAIINSNFQFPSRRITVNLASADLPKEGGRFDLPIALGILAASGQIPLEAFVDYEFIGELALSGELRPVTGGLSAALAVHQHQGCLIAPIGNEQEMALIRGHHHRIADSLSAVCAHLDNQTELPKAKCDPKVSTNFSKHQDLQDVIGQYQGKRALEIAAAGGHNLLLLGPPGTGKTMLAARLVDLLPEMTEEESLETAAISSLLDGHFSLQHWHHRPFRMPHHSCSLSALIGGGHLPKPGEISLAHNGLLFLDEMAEFSRATLDALREPLESGEITISRAARKTTFPARFQLIGALNPSPTGHYEGELARSRPQAVLRYLNRLSGPFLDRFDMSIEIPCLPKGTLAQSDTVDRGDSTEVVRDRVKKARMIMLQRRGKVNAQLSSRELEEDCPLEIIDAEFLENALHRLGLSIRAYHRIIKVGRTIADLAGDAHITRVHLAEALGYRAMDRVLQQVASQVALER